MKKNLSISLISLLFLLLPMANAWGNTMLLDFETLPDGTPLFDFDPINSQFPGLTFSGAIILRSDDSPNFGGGPCFGIGLFAELTPPNSGCNVLAPEFPGGSIDVDFANPVSSVGMFVTYTNFGSNAPLTISAFDDTNTLITTVSSTSPFFANYDGSLFGDCGVLTNCAPNEFLQIMSAQKIVRLEIGGADDFVLDDFSFTPVPEPSSLFLMLSGIGLLAGWKRHRNKGL